MSKSKKSSSAFSKLYHVEREGFLETGDNRYLREKDGFYYISQHGLKFKGKRIKAYSSRKENACYFHIDADTEIHLVAIGVIYEDEEDGRIWIAGDVIGDFDSDSDSDESEADESGERDNNKCFDMSKYNSYVATPPFVVKIPKEPKPPNNRTRQGLRARVRWRTQIMEEAICTMFKYMDEDPCLYDGSRGRDPKTYKYIRGDRCNIYDLVMLRMIDDIESEIEEGEAASDAAGSLSKSDELLEPRTDIMLKDAVDATSDIKAESEVAAEDEDSENINKRKREDHICGIDEDSENINKRKRMGEDHICGIYELDDSVKEIGGGATAVAARVIRSHFSPSLTTDSKAESEVAAEDEHSENINKRKRMGEDHICGIDELDDSLKEIEGGATAVAARVIRSHFSPSLTTDSKAEVEVAAEDSDMSNMGSLIGVTREGACDELTVFVLPSS